MTPENLPRLCRRPSDQRFDTFDLKKDYVLMSYYLHNRERVDKYLADSEKARKIMRRIEKDFPRAGLRE